MLWKMALERNSVIQFPDQFWENFLNFCHGYYAASERRRGKCNPVNSVDFFVCVCICAASCALSEHSDVKSGTYFK